MKALHFETRATRLLDSATFATAKEAAAWCVAAVAAHAKAIAESENFAESEIYWGQGGFSFTTSGGDEAEARWDWETDDSGSPVYAEFRVRDC